MQHIAIMNWNYLNLIESWKTNIETREYKTKKSPWEKISKWDIIFFKQTWKKVSSKAQVKNVEQSQTNNNWNKNYFIKIILENIQILEKSQQFDIDKSWFWKMAAWIVIDNVDKIKK